MAQIRLTNKEIKRIKSLQEKKFRDSLGLFVVEGEKLVNEALKSNFKVEAIYKEDEIGKKQMERISLQTSASPVLAVVRKKDKSLIDREFEELMENLSDNIFIGLDSIRDPGNLGTIIRSADWFGVSAIFATKDSVDLYNIKVVQSSMGSIFRLPFFYTDLEAMIKKLKDRSCKVYGSYLEGKNIYKEKLSKSNSLILMGNESRGINPKLEYLIDSKLNIPKFSTSTDSAESLNVAIATALILSEFKGS